ncbi:alpha/beta hydrolase family protein [Micromonospora saelicesensis]|uniref:alpha/beta hydrolase family protein n=1 Tax=Micromonospora saelicesensis TaxID=285676 RepID=UPI0015EB3F0B|nr:alpha/beta hydrolase [Micromonospora saelicesensis]
MALSELDGYQSPATVVMFAGFGSRRLNSTNTELARLLQPSGVRAVVCDLSGHGDSTGDIKDQSVLKAADEIVATIGYVQGKHQLEASHPIGLVGNSFSANAAIIASARLGGTLSALALKSPVTDYVAMRTKMLGESGMRRWEEDGFTVLPNGTRSDFRFIEDARSVDTYAELQQIAVPVFAVQGSADEEIPEESRRRLQALMGDRGMEYMLVAGGDHNLSDPHFKPVVAAMADFLSRHLGIAD